MVEKLPKKEDLKELILFLVRFNILLIPFYLVILFDLSFYSLQTFLASLITSLLNYLGFKAKSSGFFIYLGSENFPVDISRDCTGWKSVYSISALTFATKKGKLKSKLKFLSLAVPFLFIFNLFRVTLTILIGFYFGFHYMEAVHESLQFVVIFLILFTWYLWLKKINSREW